LAIFIFVRQKDDFSVYFIITVITLFLTALVNVNYARKYVSLRSLSQINIRRHLKSVSVLGIYVLLTSIYSVIPVTLLGFFSTKSAVGYYYGANKIIRMVISFFTALTTVMIPKLNLVFEKKGSDEYKAEIQKSLNFVIIFGIPIAFLVALLANPLIMLLAGKEFQNSIFCIQIMAPVILIVAFAQVFVLLILSINRRDKEMVLLSAFGMVISLIINIIFIPEYGERATAVSQLSAELAVTVISFFLAKRCLDFNFPIQLFLLNVLLPLDSTPKPYPSSPRRKTCA
jgi:O-antigen/teichoic acid export membrane protein